MIKTTFQKENIRSKLIKHLADATASIHLAIGWINDVGLEGLLRKKAVEGVDVILILVEDQSFVSKSVAFEELTSRGVKIIAISEDRRELLIDHKFGVIDSKIVLIGNYVWGHEKRPNEEFITINEQVQTLATGFELEFDSLKNTTNSDASKSDNAIVAMLKKMEVVKTLLDIGETEFIHLRLKEFENFLNDENIAAIHELILNQKFEEATEAIKVFLQFHDPLRACVEPPIDLSLIHI